MLKNKRLQAQGCKKSILVMVMLGFIFSIFTINLILAEPVYIETMQPEYTMSSTRTIFTGIKIYMLNQSALVSIKKYSSSDATNAYLYNATQGYIANSTFIGYVATFTPQPTLTIGGIYYLMVGSEGNNYDDYRSNDIAGLPITYNVTQLINGTNPGFADGGVVHGIDQYTINVTAVGATSSITTTLNTPSDGVATASSSITINATSTANSANLKNITFFVWKSGALFNSTTKNITGISNTSTWNVTNLVLGDYTWNAYSCGNSTTAIVCSFASSNRSFSFGSTVTSINYTLSVYETERTTFTAIFNVLSGSTVSSINLIYNGTAYPVTTISQSGSNLTISKSIDIPAIYSAIEQKNFFFSFIYGTGASQNISTYYQNVSMITLGLCNSTFTTITLNFTLKNETLPLSRISTFSLGANFQYWYGAGTSKKNLTLQNNFTTEALICLSPNMTINLDSDIDYTGTNFAQRSYYIRNATVNTTSSAITLYSIETGIATNVIINVKNQFLTNLKGHFINILRYYPGLGAYYLVERAKTDDFGNSIVKVQEVDTDYRVQILDTDGNQIYSSNPMRIVCTATPCSLEFITGETEHITQYLLDTDNIEYSLTWNNATKYINFEFTDSSGLTKSMRLIVKKTTGYGEVDFCDSTITGAAGITSCFIGNNTGTYTAKVYRTASPSKYFDSIIINLENTWQTFGTEGLIWMFFFAIIMFFVGLAIGPTVAVIMIITSLVFMMATGIVYMPFALVISIVVVAVIFIIKSRS